MTSDHGTRAGLGLMSMPSNSISQPEFGVRLEPLSYDHTAALFHLTNDPELWRYWPFERPGVLGDFRVVIEQALGARDRGEEVPYAILERETGVLAGCTRFMNVSRANRSLEIGLTWIAGGWQGTLVNLEAKTTMFAHAFDDLGAVRVQLKADVRNEQSRAAIERLGAVYEGTLRKDRVLHDGHARDTHYFSVTRDEWPGVRAHLADLHCKHTKGCTESREPGLRDVSW